MIASGVRAATQGSLGGANRWSRPCKNLKSVIRVFQAEIPPDQRVGHMGGTLQNEGAASLRQSGARREDEGVQGEVKAQGLSTEVFTSIPRSPPKCSSVRHGGTPRWPPEHYFWRDFKEVRARGASHEVEALLAEYDRSGGPPNAAMYLVSIRELAKKGLWQAMYRIMARMEEEGVVPDMATLTACVKALYVGEQFEQALEICRKIRAAPSYDPLDSEAYKWAALIYWRTGQWEEAVSLLREMQALTGSPPSTANYRLAILACRHGGQWEQAVGLLREIQKGGSSAMCDGTHLINDVIHACGKYARSLQVTSLVPGVDSRFDTASFEAALPACEQAVGLLREMQADDNPFAPNAYSYNSVIRACGNAGQWEQAICLLREMEAKDSLTPPNAGTYQRVMRACRKGHQWEQAVGLLRELQKEESPVPPNTSLFNSAIMACAKQTQFGHAAYLLSEVLEGGHPVVAEVSLPACEQAVGLLREMQGSSVSLNTVSYNAVIIACGNAGQWERAVDLLEEMQEEGSSVSADTSTFNEVLSACRKSGQWEKAVGLLREMQADPRYAPPNVLTYIGAILAFGSNGRWREAVALLDEMRQGWRAIQPDVFCYSAAITACGKNGEWEQAVRLLREMQQHGPSPGELAFRVTIKACEVNDQPELASELLREMQRSEQTASQAQEGSA